MSMIEKWLSSLDEGGHAGAFLTDFSKAFDCLNHDLLIAKLNGYGEDKGVLRFLSSYIKNQKQRLKVNASYSQYSGKFLVLHKDRFWDLICSIYPYDDNT